MNELFSAIRPKINVSHSTSPAAGSSKNTDQISPISFFPSLFSGLASRLLVTAVEASSTLLAEPDSHVLRVSSSQTGAVKLDLRGRRLSAKYTL